LAIQVVGLISKAMTPQTTMTAKKVKDGLQPQCKLSKAAVYPPIPR
jgi:hypothetical protein